MKMLENHELQPFWDLAGGQIKMKALEIALSASLFDLLQSPKTVAEIAKMLSFNLRNTEIWLDLLWSMDCLNKWIDEGLQYQSSDMAKRYFVSSSAFDCSQAVSFRFKTLESFSTKFDESLRLPNQESDDKSDQKMDKGEASYSPLNMASLWANAAKSQIFQEQRSVTVPALNAILDHLVSADHSVANNMHFLDLGCGPGLVGLALAERFPNATGVLFDYPETAEVARDNIMISGFAHCVSVQSGDLNNSQPEGVFDLIWCSSVLHFLDNADDVIARISTLLKPNGVLLILHAEQTQTKAYCERVLPFYLPMMMKGNYLPKQGDISTLLNRHGINLEGSEEVSCFPMSPVVLHVGKKIV
ncbi:methyltransferase domain-containing protein [Marinomonas sp.]|nr:class I SAM-dependent methyltransferase [Marinomonas sp.]MDB4836994.1 methyltransferase domain-containing protein [Marinomonas sp.]